MSCPRCSAPADEQTLREFGGVCPKCLLAFSEEQDAPAFPNLEIVEMIGQGGMGVVYKAVQKNLNRTVALKVLSPQLSDDPEFVERFTREARALASLSHPNIVGIYDSGIHDHVPYLVMEYVDGTPLRKLLASRKMTAERALDVIPQLCDALHYAHARGVVHRDIKPENILIDREGRVRIADFGLAKIATAEETRITRSGVVMGSAHYMAPEQVVNSGRVDHRADIYSLGVVFYEMLTGDLPIGRFKPPSARAAVDQRLDPVVLKSLEREPDDRWQSADEVKARVTRLDDGTPAERRDDRRTRFAIAAIVAVCVLAVCVIWLFVRRSPNSDVAGPILVVIAGVSLLILLAGPLRGSRLKRVEPPTRARRQALAVAAGAGAAVFIAIAVLLLVAVPASAPTFPPPPAVTKPAVAEVPKQMWRMGDQGPFNLQDAWPAKEHLPQGVLFTSQSEGEEAAKLTPIPKEAWADLQAVRRATLAEGRVQLVGYQFKSEFARRRWEMEPAFQQDLGNWKSIKGDGDSAVMLLKHDGSPTGTAANLVLFQVLERRAREAAAAHARNR